MRPRTGPGLILLGCAGAAAAVLLPATALGAWSSPAWISARDGAVYSSPDIAAGSGGRALAAFVRTPAGSAAGAARVQMASRPTTAARWSPPRVMSGRGARAPRAAMNGRGDAVVTWVSGRAIIASARRGPAGAWRAARVVVAAGPVQDVRVAVDRLGRPIVLWSERRGDGFMVRTARRSTPAVAWEVRTARLATPGPTPPSLAVSRAAAIVAWIEDGAPRASRTVGGVFEEPVEIASEGRGAPGLGVSAAGGVLAAWSVDLPGGTPVVQVSERSGPGRGWAASQDAGIGAAPLAAVNDRGDAVLGWALAEAGAPQGIEASTRRAGGRWAASTVVGRRSCACALTVGSVAVDATGTALVGWRRDDGGDVGSGGAAALPAGAGTWQQAPVAPGRTEAAPATAGAVRGGLVAWAESGRGGGVRAADLVRP